MHDDAAANENMNYVAIVYRIAKRSFHPDYLQNLRQSFAGYFSVLCNVPGVMFYSNLGSVVQCHPTTDAQFLELNQPVLLWREPDTKDCLSSSV